MLRRKSVVTALLVMLAAAVGLSAQSQVVAVRAGKMFDPKSGTNLANQVVLISGDKITDVGPASSVKIPAGAKVIDLSQATVLPGLIAHIAPDPLSGGSREEIVPGLRGLKLEYFDGSDWYDTWGDSNVKKKVKYTSAPAPNLSGFPEAVRITLLLDSDTEKSVENPEPPLAFQTVVRLELADVPAPAGGMDASDNSSSASGDHGTQSSQGTGGGMN